jgi:hypothetical protein
MEKYKKEARALINKALDISPIELNDKAKFALSKNIAALAALTALANLCAANGTKKTHFENVIKEIEKIDLEDFLINIYDNK